MEPAREVELAEEADEGRWDALASCIASREMMLFIGTRSSNLYHSGCTSLGRVCTLRKVRTMLGCLGA